MGVKLNCNCGCQHDDHLHADIHVKHVVPKKHNQLENLDYEHADHTGFAGIISNTTAYWESHADYVPVDSMLVVYTDYKETEEIHTPGLKIGDGQTKVNDLPFISASGENTPIDNLTIRLNDNNELSVNPLLAGGYIVVHEDAERASIPAGLLKVGTKVYVSRTKVTYRWDGTNWEKDAVGSVNALGIGLLLDENGVLQVDTTDEAIEGSKKPMSSGGIHAILGDINEKLEVI